MQQKSFGKLPSGSRLERIKKSKNYRDGSFQNISETSMMAEGVNYFSLAMNYFGKGLDRQPSSTLPDIKTDLRSLPARNAPILIWFGHSSYLIRVNGKNILIDPVFSQRVSPVQSIGIKGFPVQWPYTTDDLPEIDALIITHDHYDHLDYNSILKLKTKVKMIYTALGVGAHLTFWGIEETRIQEFDWWESKMIFPDIELISTPARHFSGRGLTRNKTLWSSFVMKTNDYRIFLGGDSGYDNSFKIIGDKFGPFDLALLECGQYNTMWPYIHMMPEQTVQASIDLRAAVLMPVHWGKFTLALHPWREPIERAMKMANALGVFVTTPLIGEPVLLGAQFPRTPWWTFIP